MKKSDVLKFGDAFSYPFNRAKRMWNILWLLFPIFGWFALGGYSVRIVKEFSAGKFKNLPEMKFGDDMKLGFFMFLKAIPFILAYTILVAILTAVSPVVTVVVRIFIELLMLPILFVHFMNRQTVGSLFEFEIIKKVFANIGDYLMAVLKSIGLALVFVVMIIVLVGIPAGAFTKNIFLADFYRRRVK
jgi:hypothetical protein